jgi:hypothetical protein
MPLTGCFTLPALQVVQPAALAQGRPSHWLHRRLLHRSGLDRVLAMVAAASALLADARCGSCR